MKKDKENNGIHSPCRWTGRSVPLMIVSAATRPPDRGVVARNTLPAEALDDRVGGDPPERGVVATPCNTLPADVLWAAANTAKFRLDFFRFSGTAYTKFTSLIDETTTTTTRSRWQTLIDDSQSQSLVMMAAELPEYRRMLEIRPDLAGNLR